MKRVLLALCLLCGTAYADKPEIIDEADMLRAQLSQARVELAARALDDAKKDAEAVMAGVRTKYHLTDGDGIDPQTRAIRRAPKPKTPGAK